MGTMKGFCASSQAKAPKVVWIHVGNCPSSEIEAVLRRHQADIAMLEREAAAAFLIID